MTQRERFDSLIARVQNPGNSHMAKYINMNYKHRLSLGWHIRHVEAAFRKIGDAAAEEKESLEKTIDASLEQIEFLLNDQKWL